MKTILTILMLCGVCFGYAQNTPPHAASTKTWKFGTQTWSDAIEMPDCDKTTFENSDTKPQCRRYRFLGITKYYYNWTYVKANGAKMCPTPWRVPIKADLDELHFAATAASFYDAWGDGGWFGNDEINFMNTGYLWSSAPTHKATDAWLLAWDPYQSAVGPARRFYGASVHCVK